MCFEPSTTPSTLQSTPGCAYAHYADNHSMISNMLKID